MHARVGSFIMMKSLTSFGKKPLQMGNALTKCKVLLTDAESFLILI